MACASFECFILRAVRLSNKLLGQGCVKERFRSSLRNFYGRYGDLIKQYETPSPECYKTFWMIKIYNDILHWSDIKQIFYPVTDMDLIMEFLPYCGRVQRVRHVNRGRLLLQTPGPVPIGLASVLMLRPISRELVHVLTFEFRTSLGTFVLLVSEFFPILPFSYINQIYHFLFRYDFSFMLQYIWFNVHYTCAMPAVVMMSSSATTSLTSMSSFNLKEQ